LIPNLLSISRIPLALIFCLIPNTFWRLIIVLLALVSDCLDGYLARKNNCVSKLGVVLDPIGDKVFAYSTLLIFFFEKKISFIEGFAFISRDLALIIFTFYLVVAQKWQSYQISAFILGKIFTSCQFLLMFALVLNWKVPTGMYAILGLIALVSLIELMYKQIKVKV
jgi:CDP-diacylglycerol---glycerol-3-phosphate 3-phosphatidyltransferase